MLGPRKFWTWVSVGWMDFRGKKKKGRKEEESTAFFLKKKIKKGKNIFPTRYPLPKKRCFILSPLIMCWSQAIGDGNDAVG